MLFIWATFPMLREALDVIEAWGFSYKTVAFNWVKQNKNGTGIFMGLGNWTRSNSEICLLATKGKPKRISGSVRSIVLSPLQQHSRKPAEIRDRMLDLILNGPTINGIKKDEVRAMLRETYTALKQYEKIGPMASPFINDPTAIVARAFSELYPGVEYVAQYVPDLRDETNGTAYGLTIFPDDGSTPIVCISAEAPISAAPELLAHELAHVATPEDTEHGESWSAASEAIFKKYNKLLEKLIPGEPEPIVTPYLPAALSIGDAIAMPLRDNIPEPPTDDWQLTTCPACGAECWQTDTVRRILEQEPKVRTVCTACALKGLGK